MRADVFDALGLDRAGVHMWEDMILSIRSLVKIRDAVISGTRKPDSRYLNPWALERARDLAKGGCGPRIEGDEACFDGERTQSFDRYIAVHEAGHMVVADSLGVRSLAVHNLEDRVEVVVEHSGDTPTEHFCAAAVALGGGLAQGLGGCAPDEGSQDDMEAAYVDAVAYLNAGADVGVHHQAAVHGVLALASRLALCILKKRWRTVIDVADAIDDHDGDLDTDQIADLFDRLARETGRG